MVVEVVGVYLVIYVLIFFGVFGVIILMFILYSGCDVDVLFEYCGLFWCWLVLIVVMIVMMLLLVGILLIVGFIGKFYVIVVGVELYLWWLIGVLVLGSVIGLYYYLWVMVILFLVEFGICQYDVLFNWGQCVGGIMLVVIVLLVFFFGVYLQLLLEIFQYFGLVFVG